MSQKYFEKTIEYNNEYSKAYYNVGYFGDAEKSTYVDIPLSDEFIKKLHDSDIKMCLALSHALLFEENGAFGVAEFDADGC